MSTLTARIYAPRIPLVAAALGWFQRLISWRRDRENRLYREAVKAVARGARLLDEKVPDWNYRLVVDETLVISNANACALKRLFGDYIVGRKALGLKYGEAATHGFACGMSNAANRRYRRAWAEAIAARAVF